MTTTTHTVLRPCVKCTGTGRIRAYSHVAGGVCFPCAGTGRVDAPADWREREARNAARREAREAKRVASGANAALWAEFAAAHPREAARMWELRSHPRYGYAYSSVATFDRRDSNPAQALYIIAPAMTVDV